MAVAEAAPLAAPALRPWWRGRVGCVLAVVVAMGIAFIVGGGAFLWLRRSHAQNWIAEEIYQWCRRRYSTDVDGYLLVVGVVFIAGGAGILFGFCDSLPSRS